MNIEKLKTITEKYNEAINKLQSEIKAVFIDVIREFFGENEDITAIAWKQYTPYFNDGEECIFNLGDFYITNLPTKELEENIVDVIYEYYNSENGYWTVQLNEKFPELDRALNNVDSDIYNTAFGNHVIVILKRDLQVKTVDLDHD